MQLSGEAIRALKPKGKPYKATGGQALRILVTIPFRLTKARAFRVPRSQIAQPCNPLFAMPLPANSKSPSPAAWTACHEAKPILRCGTNG